MRLGQRRTSNWGEEGKRGLEDEEKGRLEQARNWGEGGKRGQEDGEKESCRKLLLLVF